MLFNMVCNKKSGGGGVSFVIQIAFFIPNAVVGGQVVVLTSTPPETF